MSENGDTTDPPQPRSDQPSEAQLPDGDRDAAHDETDSFARLVESIGSERRIEEEEYRRQVRRSGYVDRLRDRYLDLITSAGPFEPGMIVTWKPGLKNRRYPAYNAPAIVISFEEGRIDTSQPAPSGSGGQPADLELCVLLANGQLLTFRGDSRRFRRWRSEDLVEFAYPATDQSDD